MLLCQKWSNYALELRSGQIMRSNKRWSNPPPEIKIDYPTMPQTICSRLSFCPARAQRLKRVCTIETHPGSVCPGQVSPCDGRYRPRGLDMRFLKIHEPSTHATSLPRQPPRPYQVPSYTHSAMQKAE